MALPNLSTLSLDVVDTEATEDDVFEFDEEESWTDVGAERRKRLAKRNPPSGPYPSHHVLVDDVENRDIPRTYVGNESYFEDPLRTMYKWGFYFRQQAYPFSMDGERASSMLPNRYELKQRFEREDGLEKSCRRKGNPYETTTEKAVEDLTKAISNYHSLCCVLNERSDVLGMMAMGRRAPGHSELLKLPSEWINGLRTLAQQNGLSKIAGGNYTADERYRLAKKYKINFYIEWVCTANRNSPTDLPDQHKHKGLGKTLLQGLDSFVKARYVIPAATALLVEQWSNTDLTMTPSPTNRNAMVLTPNREAERIDQGMQWAIGIIEQWVFYDFIALWSAADAWRALGFCQAPALPGEPTHRPYFRMTPEDIKNLPNGSRMAGTNMFRPLVPFGPQDPCQDHVAGPP